MRIARLLVLACVCLWPLAGRAAGAEGGLFGAEAKLWNPKVGAEFKSSTSLFDGTNIDIDKDLNLDTAKNIPYLKIWLGGRQRLAASATRIKLDGDTTLDDQIVFDGHTYAVGEKITTKLEADIYRLAWEADWISNDLFKIGTILGADYFDVSASIESKTTGIKEAEDVKGPVPIIGLLAEVNLIWGLSVYGEAAGIGGKYHDVKGSLLEAEAGLKLTLFGKASLSAGWRQMNVKVEDEDNKFALQLGGATVGLGVRF
jgi:hypothetical protein